MRYASNPWCGRPVLLAALLQASIRPAVANPVCPLPAEQPMSIVQLYFGRSIPGRGPLTDAEWSAFATRVLARNFPSGFTVSDGDGQWLNPSTGVVVHERTKIVTVAAKGDATLVKRVSAASDAYRRQFRQQPVGMITQSGCAAF